MKVRPILFNTEMVQAILSGRKTMTRRVAKNVVIDGNAHRMPPCPYGEIGDLLYVRESFFYLSDIRIAYKAGALVDFSSEYKLNPSLHMPRWASRLTLEITDIKVERLQGISEEDAIAEGLSKVTKDGEQFKFGIPDLDGLPGNDNTGWSWCEWEVTAKNAFKKLWQKINGEKSWSDNPWVWVVEFKVHHKNVDEYMEEKRDAVVQEI